MRARLEDRRQGEVIDEGGGAASMSVEVERAERLVGLEVGGEEGVEVEIGSEHARKVFALVRALIGTERERLRYRCRGSEHHHCHDS